MSIRKKNLVLGIIIFIAFLILQVSIASRLFGIKDNVDVATKNYEKSLNLHNLKELVLKMQIRSSDIYVNQFYDYGDKLNDPVLNGEIETIKENLLADKPISNYLQSTYNEINRQLAKNKKIRSESNDAIDIVHENIVMFTIILIVNIILNLLLYVFFRGIIDSIGKLDKGMGEFFHYISRQTDSVNKIEIEDNGEFQKIANDINKYIELIKTGLQKDRVTVSEIGAITDQLETGDFSQLVKSEPDNPQIKDLKLNINKFLVSMQGTLHTILNTLSNYQDNHFDSRVNIVMKGELKILVDGVNSLGDALEQSSEKIVASLTNKSQQLQKSSKDLQDSVGELTIFMDKSHKNNESVTKQIDDISKTISDTVEKTKMMSEAANDSTELAKIGGQLADDTLEAMSEISSSTEAIEDAIGIIDSISFQTNILSLNAAVEAATAGEAGKGFAVVAQEVRNLASKSAEAAKEIKELVEQTHNKTKEGIGISKNMKENFSKVYSQITGTTIMVESVAKNANKEMEKSHDIQHLIEHLREMLESNKVVMGNTTQITNELNSIADALDHEVHIKNKKNIRG
ncbi:MAG: methyl-accepting chemotaxis protein [Campylobacterota bacterium]|nr:methyl-accepting chemotaxis protein [Campylobacterota bacterium]